MSKSENSRRNRYEDDNESDWQRDYNRKLNQRKNDRGLRDIRKNKRNIDDRRDKDED